MENQELNNEAKESGENSESQSKMEQEANETLASKPQEEDWKSKYYYLAADFENQRKRFQKEKEDTAKYGAERMIRDLLDVVDNLERTIDMLKFDQDAKVKNIVFGVDMVKKQFADVLLKNGLSEVKTDGDFDPNFHEAIGQIDGEGKKAGQIVSVQQRGYLLNGRLTRAAKVIVAK
ncbi:MAG: nucleotide exchange factor GrpE [Bacteriovoracaceae bacterium]